MAEVTQVSDLITQIQQLGGSVDRDIDQDRARLYRGSRLAAGLTPMVLTTDYQVSLGDAGQHILFWSGPKNTSWRFNQRGTIQQSRTGHIAHFWRDSRRSTFFDDPSVDFTFQTGNIMPLRVDGGVVSTLPPGLLDYYDFFQFMDEKKILSNGRPNYVNIVYHSLLYPTILLRGFFEPETQIVVTDDSGKPASVEWNATFRIRESDPPFYDSQKLVSAWHSARQASKLAAETPPPAQTIQSISTEEARQRIIDESTLAALNLEAELAEQQRLADRNLIDFITGDE